MKLVALLCWYDEKAEWLAGVAAGLHMAGVAHVVAVDGAYAAYPNGRGSSSPEQHAALDEVCRELKMGLTLHVPAEPYAGNEVEKRSLSMRLAETVTEPFEDWYLIVDADHFVTSAIGHLDKLAETDLDTASIAFQEPYGQFDGYFPLRCLYRAIPGLTYERNHFSVMTPDGRNLQTATGLDLSCLQMEHRTMHREAWRRERQQSYYERRNRLALEEV